MVVCGSGPRAVVTTASYEARKLAGIHSAMPAAVARRRLPNAVYLPPDFPAYREASAVVMEVLQANVEVVEVVGLDEAYLDLTGIFSPKATMRRIKAEIRELTGLTCSVGISESRMLAKMTSELGKPNGLVVISHEEAMARFGAGPPGVVPGIGPKTGGTAGKARHRRASRRSVRGTAATSKRGSGPAPAPGSTPAATSATRRRSASAARPNRSRWRRPSTSTSPSSRRWSGRSASRPRSSAGGCARRTWRGARSGSRSASTTGPTITRARSRWRARPTTRGRLADRPRPAAGLRPAAAGPPARRPPRLLRERGRRRRRGGRAATPAHPPRLTSRERSQFPVAYRGVVRTPLPSGWRARRRRPGSRGDPWSLRSGRIPDRRRRGRGRSPAR